MARDVGEYRDEPQDEATEVVRNVIEPDEVNRERIFGSDRTRSSTSFPSNDEGRDGDRLAVIKGGRQWMCEKVRGTWTRTEIGKIQDPDPAEKTAQQVTNKAVNNLVVTGIEEAPIDGNEYVRKDADWTRLDYVLRDVTISGGSLPTAIVTIDGGTL